jgi:hypothetical protein
MSPSDREQYQAWLPLHADPSSGALIGTFLLAACLAGPVGLVVVLVAWIVMEAIRRDKRRSARSLSQSVPTDDE